MQNGAVDATVKIELWRSKEGGVTADQAKMAVKTAAKDDDRTPNVMMFVVSEDMDEELKDTTSGHRCTAYQGRVI